MADFNKVIKIQVQGEKGIENLSIELNKSTKNIAELEEHLEILNKGLKQVDKNSNEFKTLSKEAQRAKLELEKAEDAINGFTSVQKSEGLFKLSEGIAGIGGLAVVAAQAFGDNAEEFEKYQTQLLQLVVVFDSVKKVAEGFSGENRKFLASLLGLNKGFLTASLGAKAFGAATRGALAATGIGLILVAVSLLVEHWDKVVEAVEGFGHAFDGVKNAILPALKLIGSTIKNYIIVPWQTFFNLLKETYDFITGEEFNAEEIARPFNEAVQEFKDGVQEIGDAYHEGVTKSIEEENLEILKSTTKLNNALRDQHLRLIEDEIANEETSFKRKKELLKQKLDLVLENLNKEIEILDKQRKLAGELTDEEKIEYEKLQTDKILALRAYEKDIDKINKDIAQKAKERAEEEERKKKEQLERLKQLEDDFNSLTEKEFNDTLHNLEDHYQERLNIQKQKLLEGEITEEQFAEATEALELDKLEKLRQAYIDYGKDTTDIDSRILDVKLKNKQKELEEDKKQKEKLKEQQRAMVAFISNTVQQSFAVIQQFGEVAQNVLQERIDQINESIESQKEKVEEQQAAAEEASGKINDIEGKLSAARDERFEQLIKQRDLERIKREQALKQAENEAKKQKQLEEKKIEEEKKAARIRKGIALAQAIINGGLAITNAALTIPFIPAGLIAMGIATTALAAQVATIATQKFAKGGLLVGKSHAEGGIKGQIYGQNIELEGGEAVISKKATAMFKPILSAMNVAGGGKAFATGGVLPSADLSVVTDATAQQTELVNEIRAMRQESAERELFVSVEEINAVNSKVRAAERRASI